MPKDVEKALRGCFHPKEGRPNLQKVPVNAGRAKQHIDKARRNLRAMKIMFDNELFDWTIICGYYAIRHVSRGFGRVVNYRYPCNGALLRDSRFQKILCRTRESFAGIYYVH
jgi:hypothetical protein